MTKIAVEVTEKQDRLIKFLSMEKHLSSKAKYIENIISEYLEKENVKKHIPLISKDDVRQC